MPPSLAGHPRGPPQPGQSFMDTFDNSCQGGLEAASVSLWNHGENTFTPRAAVSFEKYPLLLPFKKAKDKPMAPNFFMPTGAIWTIPFEFFAPSGYLSHRHVSVCQHLILPESSVLVTLAAPPP